MTRLQETLEVPRPIEDVFRYISNFANVEQWDPGVVESAKLSSGPLRVGCEFRVVVKFGVRLIHMDYVITTYEPPTRVVLEGAGGSIPAIDDICFVAKDGGTRICYSADITFSGLTGIAAPLFDGILNRVGTKAMAGLQTALSQEPPLPSNGVANYVMDRLILPGMLGFTASHLSRDSL